MKDTSSNGSPLARYLHGSIARAVAGDAAKDMVRRRVDTHRQTEHFAVGRKMPSAADGRMNRTRSSVLRLPAGRERQGCRIRHRRHSSV